MVTFIIPLVQYLVNVAASDEVDLVASCQLSFQLQHISHIAGALCQDTCSEGELRVTGPNTIDLIAGCIELCIGMEWRAVCHGGWDLADAIWWCVGNWGSLQKVRTCGCADAASTSILFITTCRGNKL